MIWPLLMIKVLSTTLNEFAWRHIVGKPNLRRAFGAQVVRMTSAASLHQVYVAAERNMIQLLYNIEASVKKRDVNDGVYYMSRKSKGIFEVEF
jgi:hypothetical protein